MKTGETHIDYNVRILQSVITDQARRYFRHTKKFDNTGDDDLVSQLSSKLASCIHIAASIEKIYKQEKRITKLEQQAKLPMDTTMFEDAPLKEFR